MLPESRRLAEFLLTQPTDADWDHALRIDNILQKKTPATARRQARLIRNRLEAMPSEALHMICGPDSEISMQMLLLAAVKHSRLLGDFMRDVVGRHVRSFQDSLTPKDWDDFFTECMHRDPIIATWSQTTRAKLHQVVLRILKETRYIDSTRHPRLCRVLLHPAVNAYMEKHHEQYPRACMELYA